MKRILALPGLLLVASALPAEEIDWLPDYETAVAEARSEMKPIFVLIAPRRGG